MRKFCILYAICVVLLTSCGFQPLYGDGNACSAECCQRLTKIKLGEIKYPNKLPSRESIALTAALQHEFGYATAENKKEYVLNVSYDIAREAATIQSDSTITRVRLNVRLQYELLRMETAKSVITGNIIGAESFDVTNSPYSNYVSEEETIVRMMSMLANQLKLKIAIEKC